jgi:polyisoprenoid-binding protein YceI
MYKRFCVPLLTAVVLSLSAAAARADDYVIDPMHSGVNFKISHLGLSWVAGRFNELSGGFTIDPDAGKCSFALTIKAQSVDTNNQKRDDHLRSGDFFNVAQYPTITFESTSVKAGQDGGYQVTGDLTMHGEKKPVTFTLVGGRQAEFPKGFKRTGFSTDLTVKRSEFGIDKFPEMLGEDVSVSISFEGTKK